MVFMNTQQERWPKHYWLLIAIGAWIAKGSLGLGGQVNQLDLAEVYPTTLTDGDADPSRARPWVFTASDIYHLTGFSFGVGPGFRVETGAADLGVGHCTDGAVWGVVIPRAGGTFTSDVSAQPEPISHVWLRFHPKIVGSLFPTPTVLADGNQALAAEIGVIANFKLRSSWHAGNNVMIPPPNELTVDVDTVGGPRRFFDVDTSSAEAHYYSDFEQSSVPVPPGITADLAASTFDQLWSAFDRDYAMFVLRPEVDWTALKEQYRPQALASKSAYEFAEACADMLRPLRDLHVWLTLAGANVTVYDRPRFSNANPSAYESLLAIWIRPASRSSGLSPKRRSGSSSFTTGPTRACQTRWTLRSLRCSIHAG